MYLLTKNIVAFQKGLICLPNAAVDNRSLAITVQAELMKFGYMLDQDAFLQLGKADKADIVDFNNEIISYLRYMTGGDHAYAPFYPGFPEQVMEMTEFELWWNQLVYYWSNCKFEAQPWMKPFKTAFETVKYKMLVAGTEESFQKIFTSLVSAGQSLTPQDLDVIKWFVSTKQTLIFPDTIPFKENLCTLAGMGLDVPVKTPTDVLRIAVHMSGGDISLPAVPKRMVSNRKKTGSRYSIVKETNPERKKFEFKKFKRAERRYILGLLEKTHCDVREMVLKDQRWIRLGEILHPGEYAKDFPRTASAFQLIRETKIVSWYGAVEAAFKKTFGAGLQKLAERPGEFLRKLDYLLRKNGAKQRDAILTTFFEIAVKASNKVLFEVYTHFEGRDKPVTDRSVFIKGARKKTPLPNLPALPADTIQAVQDTIFQALKAKFALLEPMGDCWIDPELKKIPLPTNMRSLSESLVPVIRGQRIPMAIEKKVIRPFIHWYDERGTEDIDLHGFLLGKQETSSFGFNGIHSSAIGCYSGDVRCRKGACAEYVDINIANAVAAGYQYFVMVAHNFQNKPFSSLKDCVVGVQERENATANKAWLPETITNCFRPTSASTYALIGVYDLTTREYIHLDLDWGTFSRYVNSGDGNALLNAIAPFVTLPKYSVYDLLSWHVEARGRATSKELAATHFLYDDFGTSYTKTIEYMGI
jgi:hypothetical protein